MRAHTFELAFAAGSALFGGLAFLVALLAATTTRSETESAAGTVVVTTEHHSPGFEWLAAIALTLVALLLVWLVVAATLHAQLGIIRTSAALWVPALVLTLFAWATGFSVGLFFVPSALFALLAAAAATRAGPAQRGRMTNG